MRFAKIILCILSIPFVCALARRASSQMSTQPPAKGKRIVIEGSKIIALDPITGPKAGPIEADFASFSNLLE